MKDKERIDKLLVDKQLAPSRERAQAMVMAGVIYVGTQRISKPSELFSKNSVITVKGEDHPYVSRGGVKLAGALDAFSVQVKDRICLDIGISTGGFTDCLLQRGAAHVFGVDVGYGQTAWKIRSDKRVQLIEKMNIRYLDKDLITQPVSLVVIDVSFISLRLVLPQLCRLFCSSEYSIEVIALIKPQFEAGKDQVPKGGVITDTVLHQKIVDALVLQVQSMGAVEVATVPSNLKGGDGNQEFLMHACFSQSAMLSYWQSYQLMQSSS